MCHCIAQYYAMCRHLDRSWTTVIHCEKVLDENYDCQFMKEWYLPRYGSCHLCRYQRRQQRKSRRHEPKKAAAPQPEKIADANEDGVGDGDWNPHGQGLHEDSDHDLEIQSLNPDLGSMGGSNELQKTVQPCPTPPSTSSVSSSWDRPVPGLPSFKRRAWSSSIPVPTRPVEAPARRSLIPLPADKGRRHSVMAGDDRQVFDRVTF